MNSIEHLWELLECRVSGRPQVPQTVADLRQGWIHEWRNIPQADISNLINSMRRGCTGLLCEHGGHTHYLRAFELNCNIRPRNGGFVVF